jgi:hypothetical protein
MFGLEQSISEWRKQMLAAGIKAPVPLEELEIHLREEIDQRSKSGLDEREIFNSVVLQIGQAHALNSEFRKVGETIREQIKSFVLTLSGVHNPQLVTNMNTTNSNIEPRWATYFKNIVFILPAIFLWVGSSVFVLPKLKQIFAVSNMAVPKPMLTAVAMSEFFKNNLFLATILIVFALVLLEWRSGWWMRHRRLVFGIAAFVLNSIALILITTLFVLAVMAGANLLPHAH